MIMGTLAPSALLRPQTPSEAHSIIMLPVLPLVSCPFCGNQVLSLRTKGGCSPVVCCPKCDASGPVPHTLDEMAAYALWNIRVDDTDAAQQERSV